MRLSTAFYPQTDRQTEQINQKLEQYLRFFTEYRQRDWLKQLVIAEFVVNNKVYVATNILPFITNYRRELRMEANIRRKEKIEKAAEFVKRIKRVQKEVRAILRKIQKEIKRQVDRERREEFGV